MAPDQKKETARLWFRDLRDRICAEFEKIETEYATTNPPLFHQPGHDPRVAFHGEATTQKFSRTLWQRPEGGGGEISILKGRVFEKVGVNISVVHGEFSEQFRKEMPHTAADPRFWAAGISLVAHMQSPHVPAIHMNTRMIVVGDPDGSSSVRSEDGPSEPERSERGGSGSDGGSAPSAPKAPGKIWFGGGADLNPMVPNDADTAQFHSAFQAACDATDPTYYAKFKKWCDDYFWLPHRQESRGVGGIFYDYLDTDWDKHFAFTQAVGETFLSTYPQIVRQHMHEPWTDAERHHQLIRRGRYAEFNLLHDRGTRFGLMTGGNTDAILMSLPPLAIWE